MVATYTYKELQKIANELMIDVDDIKICDPCGDVILPDDEYFDFNTEIICMDCIDKRRKTA